MYFAPWDRERRIKEMQRKSMVGIAVACCVVQRAYRQFRFRKGAVQLYKNTGSWRERRKQRADYVKIDMDVR